MMALRTIVNLFLTAAGRAVAAQDVDEVVSALEHIVGVSSSPAVGPTNRNVQIAVTSVAFNYACLAYAEHRKSSGGSSVGTDALALLVNVLGKVLQDQSDGEVLYRGLMALGMVLVSGSSDVKETAKVLGAEEWIRGAAAKASAEERVKDVAGECLGFLR
jgi:phospholipase A-2-activating protein